MNGPNGIILFIPPLVLQIIIIPAIDPVILAIVITNGKLCHPNTAPIQASNFISPPPTPTFFVIR